jgi:Sulfotransferase family
LGKPVFILGVGAQKAGTSFLHRALGAHPAVALSDPKEMHVFDAHFLPDLCGQFHRRRREALGRLLSEEPDPPGPFRAGKTAALLRHVLMHYDLSEYTRHFRERARGKACTGDITPAYQMLDAAAFRAIRDLLVEDFEIRPILLLRDPIDRIFSAMRMDDRNGQSGADPAHRRFAISFMIEKHRRRTEYEKVIPALDAVFGEGAVFYEFYENLFRPEAFERLGRFLGLGGLRPDFEGRVNASPILGKLDEAAIAAARGFYEPTYAFCRERFGAEAVRRHWPRA